jgi:hypothetical protein
VSLSLATVSVVEQVDVLIAQGREVAERPLKCKAAVFF